MLPPETQLSSADKQAQQEGTEHETASTAKTVCSYTHIRQETSRQNGDKGQRWTAYNDKGDNSSRRHNSWDFPSGPVVKNLPCKAGEAVSVPGLGRSHTPRSN